MKKKKAQQLIAYGILFLVMLLCVGCGKSLEERTSSGVVYYNPNASEETEIEVEETTEPLGELYLILSNNSVDQTLNLYSYENGLEYHYYYALTTRFLNKYGDYASVALFTPGNAVHIGEVDSSGKLTTVQMSNEVWEYKDVNRFSIEEERAIFEIADTRYNYNDETFVFSYDDEITMEDISENDKLTVIGKDKKILSVMVTTGQGTIQLSNTKLFEGSFLQLDRDIFAEITADMTLEVPEGTYTLTVANNGWGGSCDITITRGQTTAVDLDTIKGEGPKYGTILFSVDIEGAKIVIDGKQIDTTQPQTLQYGKHSISVSADGYKEWTKYLYVNSEEATIMISLEKESTTNNANDDAKDEDAKDEENSEDDKENNKEDETDLATEDELMRDYFSTLTELIGSL